MKKVISLVLTLALLLSMLPVVALGAEYYPPTGTDLPPRPPCHHGTNDYLQPPIRGLCPLF